MTGGLAVGRTLDRYVIERPLGHGGMATVVQVRHTVLGTVHAMKVLHLSTPRLIDRLLREGRVQASLRHPNLVAVTDVVSIEQGVALILEYVAGPTLSDLIKMFRPTISELDALADQVMQGVASAHGQGVIHRDLKPANVLVALTPEGLVAKVTDFGLARALEDGLGGGAPLTHSGVPMGTPGYMAPEQLRNARDVDQRADIFSLGALLYELVTGRAPFDAWDLLSVYDQVMKGQFLPIDVLCPELPQRFERAIRAALSPEPAERPPDVASLRALWFDGASPPPVLWEAEHLVLVDRWIQIRADRVLSPNPPGGARQGALPTAPPSAPSTPSPGTYLALTPEVLSLPPSAPGRRPVRVVALLLGVALLTALAVSARLARWSRPAVDPAAPETRVEGAAVVAGSAAEQGVGVASVDAGEAPATVLASSAPASQAKEPAPAREPATLVVSGVERAILVGSDGQRRDAAGRVPPGTYRLMIPDQDGNYVQVLRRTFRAGERVKIVCQPTMSVCREL